MKPKSISLTALERYGLIEPLESRISPAAATSSTAGFLDKAIAVTGSVGGSIKLTTGELLTTGSAGGGSGPAGGIYLIYVEQGQVLVHTTDLNNSNQFETNDITGLSLGPNARIDCFVDIHGDIVTDLNSNFTLTDSDHNAANGYDGRVLLDYNIDGITMRSLQASDFSPTATETSAQIVNDHLALSSYSIFGSIYAGGGLGVSTDPTSGLHIDTSGAALQSALFTGATGVAVYSASTPVVGGIFVGTAASGQLFSFGSNGQNSNVSGTLLPFSPAVGEAGASIYNISSTSAFSIGTIHAGDGGFNAPGGNIENVALQGDAVGATQLIAGNAGVGTTGHAGGSVLNFSDTGSIQGSLLVQAGNGGKALTGAGGNGGAISIATGATVGVNARVVFQLGNGGNGYTAGGNGASLSAGKFVTPEGTLTHGTNVVTTMRTLGSVGQTQYIDFNGDGYSDAVYTTTTPDMLAVALGGPQGFTSQNVIYLSSLHDITGITVADFTGNGHPDIAVSSGTATAASVEVFFSQYTSTGKFEGFSAPEFVSLPDLSAYGQYLYTLAPATAIAAGDFSGDGHMDLAVAANETTLANQVVPVVIVLTNTGTGHFFANFQNATLPSANNNGPQMEPFYTLTQDISTNVILKATAPTQGATSDILIATEVGAGNATVLGGDPVTNGTTLKMISTLGFGQVDTSQTTAANTALVDFAVLNLVVVQDPKTPTQADIVALSQSPASFLVAATGDGTGKFKISTNPNPATGFQSGIGLALANPHVNAVDLVAVPNTTTPGVYSDVAYLDYETAAAPQQDLITAVNMAANMSTGVVSTTEVWTIKTPQDQDTQYVAFDEFNDQSNSTPTAYDHVSFISAIPDSADTDPQAFQISLSLNEHGGTKGGHDYFFDYKQSGYNLIAGDGGNALDGSGGGGGSIGQNLTVTTVNGIKVAEGSVSLLYPLDTTFDGVSQITAGNGGNGFKNGGSGGNGVGFSVNYAGATGNVFYVLTGETSTNAGNGGQGLEGAGGAGGSLSQMYVQSGDGFQAGDGGFGAIGGSGGAVVGTKISGLATNTNVQNGLGLNVFAGNGASGLIRGGNGGNIDTFQTEFIPIIGEVGGFLFYEAGSAGDAVAGAGGAGGSVLNSSPQNFGPGGADNNLAGDIFLIAGSGGNGLSGGVGGGIQSFVDSPSIAQNPGVAFIVSGDGGTGTSGPGGGGGNISGIVLPTTGISVDSTLLNYDRIVAGYGGSSSGGGGGAGGSLSGITTTASAATAQYFLAAGAGGGGLKSGGAGGSVTNTSVDAGAQSGKITVVAGDGGNSYSVKFTETNNVPPTPTDIANSVGDSNGPGGNGGSIVTFTQPAFTNTDVDLIAGNGGATVNHSATETGVHILADNSGSGGSIAHVHLAGNIGNVNPGVAIQSYNDFFGGQTMEQFIQSNVLGSNANQPLTDAVGNVGLVAGAAGRVLDGVPSTNKINGSVTDIHAQAIMSMIAGSVDQVDSIRSLTNYSSVLGEYGTAKTGFTQSFTIDGVTYAYTLLANETDWTVNGVAQTPLTGPLHYTDDTYSATNTPLPGGGLLLDGAIWATNIRTIQGNRDFQGTVV